MKIERYYASLEFSNGTTASATSGNLKRLLQRIRANFAGEVTDWEFIGGLKIVAFEVIDRWDTNPHKRRVVAERQIMKNEIAGISKLNLEPGQAEHLMECLTKGRTWFVTRKRTHGRAIQASCETRMDAEKVLRGWHGYDVSLIQVTGNKVVWHTPKGAPSPAPNSQLLAERDALREALNGMMGNYIELKKLSLIMARRDKPHWGEGLDENDDIHVIAARAALALSQLERGKE